jgi:hypothetical protein
MPPTIALLDADAGYLQWIGTADSHEAAIRAHLADVGHNDDVEYELRVMDITVAQAAALQEWADTGFKGSDCPPDLPRGVVYGADEIEAIAQAD